MKEREAVDFHLPRTFSWETDHGYSEISRTTAFAEQLDFLVDARLPLVYPGRLHTG